MNQLRKINKTLLNVMLMKLVSVPLFFMNDQEEGMNPDPYRMALEASNDFHRIRGRRIDRGQAPSESTL